MHFTNKISNKIVSTHSFDVHILKNNVVAKDPVIEGNATIRVRLKDFGVSLTSNLNFRFYIQKKFPVQIES